MFFHLDENFDVKRVKTSSSTSAATGDGDGAVNEADDCVWQGLTAVRSEFALTYSQADRLLRGLPADDSAGPPKSQRVLEHRAAGTPVPEQHTERVRKALTWLVAAAERRQAQREVSL